MKISELKKNLKNISILRFKLPNGHVPEHFHITEAGISTKEFVDCGGFKRKTESFCFQIWTADDFEHRLTPEKLLLIIDSAEKYLDHDDLSIEVEYQGETIGVWNLEFENNIFSLIPKKTDCLAKDKCGLSVIQNETCSGVNCC